MAECWVLTASRAGPVSARPVGLARGFEQIGATQASREPSPDLYSEAMMIRPVSLAGIHGPGFRCHGSPMRSSRVIISCPYGRGARLRVESASQCDGAVGLRVPAVEPGISRLTLAGDRASSVGPEEHDLPDSSQYGNSSHPVA